MEFLQELWSIIEAGCVREHFDSSLSYDLQWLGQSSVLANLRACLMMDE